MAAYQALDLVAQSHALIDFCRVRHVFTSLDPPMASILALKHHFCVL